MLFKVIALALACSVSVAAQKPTGAKKPTETETPIKPQPLAGAFKVELENDWVTADRVHYDARAEVPLHDHPPGVSVYLYLNPSDGVKFYHANSKEGDALSRPAVQPGAIRVANTRAESHKVVNTAATPSDFLRVQLKTQRILGVGNPGVRMAPTRMEYDHPLMRVARLNVAPHSKLRLEARNAPVLRIALVPGAAEWKTAASDAFRFLDKGAAEDFDNTSDQAMQLLTIELRTLPLAKK